MERLDPKRFKPEHLAALAQLIQAERKLDPESAFLEALDLIVQALAMLRYEPEQRKSKGINHGAILKELVDYMETTGKGATEIAKSLEVNRATVSLWKSGKGRPGRKAIARIVRFLAAHSNNSDGSPPTENN
jgi:hypothetical protein